MPSGEINVAQVMQAHHDERRRLDAFVARMWQSAEALAVDEWLKSDDKDEVKARWGEYLTTGLERWKRARKIQAAIDATMFKWMSGRISSEQAHRACVRLEHQLPSSDGLFTDCDCEFCRAESQSHS